MKLLVLFLAAFCCLVPPTYAGALKDTPPLPRVKPPVPPPPPIPCYSMKTRQYVLELWTHPSAIKTYFEDPANHQMLDLLSWTICWQVGFSGKLLDTWELDKVDRHMRALIAKDAHDKHIGVARLIAAIYAVNVLGTKGLYPWKNGEWK